VIISPADLRRIGVPAVAARSPVQPPWLVGLYADLARRLQEFPLPAEDAGATAEARAARTGNAAARCEPYDAADCERQCEQGDVASCARAGVLYGGGRGITADAPRAWALLNRSCANGHALGCGGLSELVLDDEGLRRDAARAAALARVACDGGDGHGCARLAELCNERLFYPDRPDECSKANVMRLRERAVAALTPTCEGWAAYDCYTLAAIYAPGDRVSAVRFAAGSCTAGDPGGCDLLGTLRARPASLTPASARIGTFSRH
jgi:TPR repeat protein